MMDDVIYRHVLRDAMYHEAFEVDSDLQKWDGGCWIRYKMFENVIDKIPSAQKKGHWIYPTDVKGFCRCECCGALWGRDLYENRFFKYCPRCGADMRGEDDADN